MTKIQQTPQNHISTTHNNSKGEVVSGVGHPLIRAVSTSNSTTGKQPRNGTSTSTSSGGSGSSVHHHNTTMTSIGTKPTLMQVQSMKFLIMDAPRQSNLHLYIKEMRKHGVTDVVRVCEPTYQGAELQAAGISLHEMEYADGHSPPMEVIDQWLALVDNVFYSGGGASANGAPTVCIAVHCVAGLGRAPAMVALGLIEFANMDPVEAVSLIRRHRRGAINEKQLLYLEEYKRHYRKQSAEGGCCIVM